MKRDAMVFYRSFYEAGRFLSDQERLDYYDRILNYWIEWIEKKKWEKVEMLFSLIQPNIDSNNKKYIMGSKWWAPKWNSNAQKDFETKQPVVEWKNNHRLKNKTTNVDVDVEEDVNNNKKISFWNFVKLTEKEYQKLINDFNKKTIDSKIEDVNNYCWSVWKKYKDYNLTIRSWLKKDWIENIDYLKDIEKFWFTMKKDYNWTKEMMWKEQFFKLKKKAIERASLNNKL